MRKITKYNKSMKIAYIKAAITISIICLFFLPHYQPLRSQGDNMFALTLNEVFIGTVGSVEDADEYIRDARKALSSYYTNMLFIDTEIVLEGKEVYFGAVDSKSKMTSLITNVLKDNIKQTMRRSYIVKVNDVTVNLGTSEEVVEVLNATLDKYDLDNRYDANLQLDPTRELNVLIPDIISTKPQKEEPVFPTQAGIEAALTEMTEAFDEDVEKQFSDFELGLVGIKYSEEFEVVEAYLTDSDLSDVNTVVNMLTEGQEVQQIYEVVAGDTLSAIAYMHDLPIENIVKMNDALIDENTTLQIGQKIIITVPKPELTVIWDEEVYYEETYEADVVYVPNDSWYTTTQVTLQEPSSGFRKVVAVITKENETEINRTIIKEELVVEAIPKIVEKGTKVPPTFIKPIAGGRLTSTFGRRKAPTRGASSFHKAIDWSTPRGTPVVASSGGKVIKAGWSGGYGYVVAIRHADGRETRYAHLSKVQCSVGQFVSQGERIALTGNTGISSGPHLHFEMLINGSQVDPLEYLN